MYAVQFGQRPTDKPDPTPSTHMVSRDVVGWGERLEGAGRGCERRRDKGGVGRGLRAWADVKMVRSYYATFKMVVHRAILLREKHWKSSVQRRSRVKIHLSKIFTFFPLRIDILPPYTEKVWIWKTSIPRASSSKYMEWGLGPDTLCCVMDLCKVWYRSHRHWRLLPGSETLLRNLPPLVIHQTSL